MGSVVEDYAKKYAESYAKKYAESVSRENNIQTAENLLKNNVSVDVVAKSIPALTYDFIVELNEKILQSDK
jgi:hypothetical protein